MCLSPAEQEKIKNALITLEKCEIDMKARQQYIDQRLANIEAATQLAWWQEPKVVVGGLVVTFSVATLATLWVAKR